MNSTNNLGLALIKAILLAIILFWIQIIAKDFTNDTLFMFMISIIPISIICSITVIITIFPFYFIKNRNTSNKDFFNKYFPFYSIICFSICLYFIIVTDFEFLVFATISTAFFTLMQTWIWVFKTNNNLKDEN